jgi:hypothetical protein
MAAAARNVRHQLVRRLAGVYVRHIELKLARWEPNFYEATRSFQEQIGRAEQFDLVIGILWKRIGSELPPDLYRRPDGSAFESGTVLELESALAAAEAQGSPSVYVFRKTAPITFAKERAAYEQRQSERLDAWWQRTFRDSEGRYRRGSEPFPTTEAFENRVEALIDTWLKEKGHVPAGPVWDITVSSPYPGLQPYDRDRRAVFFGRDLAIRAALDEWRAAAARANGQPALFVVGPSGSGKSSLVRAGLAAEIIEPGAVPNVDLWREVTVECDSGVISALATTLYGQDGLPELTASPQPKPESWARLATGEPGAAAEAIVWALDRVGEAEKQRTGADRVIKTCLLLIVNGGEKMCR